MGQTDRLPWCQVTRQSLQAPLLLLSPLGSQGSPLSHTHAWRGSCILVEKSQSHSQGSWVSRWCDGPSSASVTLPTLPSPSPTFLTRFEIGVPEAIWMDLEIIIPSEVSQKEKDKYHTLFLICGIQNVTQMKLSAEQKQAHREQTCGCQSGGRKGRDGLRVWEQQVQTVMLRMDNSKVLLNSTGNCTQSLGVNHNGKAHKEECMYVYNWVTLQHNRS